MHIYQIILFAAEEVEKKPGLLDAIIGNIGNILLVIAFGAGLWFVNRWSIKIKAEDEQRRLEEEAQAENAAEEGSLTEKDAEEGMEDAVQEEPEKHPEE